MSRRSKTLSLIMSMAFAMAILVGMTVTAAAYDSVSYKAASWDSQKEEVKYTDGSKVESDYIVVGNSADAVTWTGGNWYVVKDSVTIEKRITVNGTVNLILCDGATLTAKEGITVVDDNNSLLDGSANTLNIYGQSGNSGRLLAGTTDGNNTTCLEDAAGIGGIENRDNDRGGKVVVHGGRVTARGSYNSAGIGGGCGGRGPIVDVYGVDSYGGNVTATGGDEGAGIGGSVCYSHIGGGGRVTVYGGNVTATGGDGAAGIGNGGNFGENPAYGGSISVWGGTVTATGTNGGAGIGGGDCSDGAYVWIHGGTVTATGYDGGAGIGGGYEGNGYDVAVYGGVVNAESKSTDQYFIDAGAGIGGGYKGECDNVEIYGGTVTATGDAGAAGIGAGEKCKEQGGLEAASGLDVCGGDSADNMSVIKKINDDYARFRYMAVKKHTHDFTYSASGNTVTATCSVWGCPLKDNKVTLSVNAADAVYSKTGYTGASLDSEAWTEAGLNVPTMEYEGRGDTSYTKSATAPENVGTYTASVTVEGKTATADFEITQKALTIDSATATHREYIKGKKDVVISAVTFKDGDGNQVALTKDDDYIATGVMDTDTAGEGKPVNVSVALINKNYSLAVSSTTTTVLINKGYTQILDIPVTLIHTTEDVSLPAAGLMPEGAGALTYTVGAYSTTGTVQVSDFIVDNQGNVKAKLSGGEVNDIVRLPVTIESTNYVPSTFTFYITLTARKDADVKIRNLPDGALTYGDENFILTGSVGDPGSGSTKWEWTTSNASVLHIKPSREDAKVTILKPGSAMIYVTFESKTTIGTASALITVNPKDLTVKAIDKNIKVGDAVPDLSHPVEGKDYIVEGLVGEDTMQPPSLAYSSAPDNSKAGTYQIYAYGQDAGPNYALAYQDATLAISETPAPAPTPADTTPVGSVHDLGGSVYAVTSAGTVSVVKAPSVKSFTIPAEVVIDGKTFSVTGINAKAFAGTKVKTLTVRTKALTKASVRGFLKGSKVRTVKVKVGKKKENKKYVKIYKKFFTKKNCGKKVSVRR